MPSQSQRTLDVALFAHLVSRPEDELDLAQAALLIAEPEYPELDIAAYLRELDELAALARPRLDGVTENSGRAVALVQFLLEDQGFSGNVDKYEDPRNSFLNEVLERRLGIPITLSLVILEVAARLRITMRGVSFPGHFLVDTGGAQPLLLDPFTGKTLGTPELSDLLERVYGQRRPPRPDELQPATKHAILLRMLHNLRNIYVRSGDGARQRLAEERIRVLESAVRTLASGGSPGAAGRPGVLH